MHYFSTPFLASMAHKLKQQGQYHVAKKKIPSKDGPIQVASASGDQSGLSGKALLKNIGILFRGFLDSILFGLILLYMLLQRDAVAYACMPHAETAPI